MHWKKIKTRNKQDILESSDLDMVHVTEARTMRLDASTELTRLEATDERMNVERHLQAYISISGFSFSKKIEIVTISQKLPDAEETSSWTRRAASHESDGRMPKKNYGISDWLHS